MTKKIFSYLFNFAKIQTIVTLASLPILVAWGIPISLMTFVGNFIFTPFLTVFLLLSSLIFFAELLCLPNNLLITALTTTTSYWEYFLSFGKKSWLIGFAKPGTTLTILLFVLLVLLALRFIFRVLSKLVMIAIIALSLSITTHYLYKAILPSKPLTKLVPNCEQKLSVALLPNKTIQINDYGFFNQKRSPEKFITFELKPYLIKNYGATTIDKIILHNPRAKSFRAVQELYKTFGINEVAVAYFNYRLSRYGWKCFYSLKNMIVNDGGKFTRFRQSYESTSPRK